MTSTVAVSLPHTFRTLKAPEVVSSVLTSLGWEEWDDGDPPDAYSIYWKNGPFLSSEHRNVRPYMRLNHFPRSAGLTRKDKLLRALRYFWQINTFF
jgi:hypothetical protein